MKTITDYITALFLGIEETEQIKQVKKDLLANAEDRYEDLKSQGKSENEAIGAVISEFGSIDELLEEMNIKQEYETEYGCEPNEITSKEAQAFLSVYHRGATLIGLGVMLIILGVAMMFLAEATFNNDLGVLFIFLGTAIGVPFFIIAGTSMSNISKQFNDRLIPMSIQNEVKKRKEAFHRTFVVCIVSGVSLCILSVVPLILLTEVFTNSIHEENYELLGGAGMLLLVSIGVFFFIFGGVIMGSFTKLTSQMYFVSNEDKPGPKAKAERNKKKAPLLLLIEKIYWPIIVVVYFIQSFIWGNWGTSWSIFVVAGIVFSIIESVLSKE